VLSHSCNVCSYIICCICPCFFSSARWQLFHVVCMEALVFGITSMIHVMNAAFMNRSFTGYACRKKVFMKQLWSQVSFPDLTSEFRWRLTFVFSIILYGLFDNWWLRLYLKCSKNLFGCNASKLESIMLQIDSRAFAEFVLARLDLVKIEKYLMQRSKVLFGRSAVIRVHWVCLWIFLGSSNHFYLPIDVFWII